MAKVTLNDIGTLANNASARQALNDNFQKIEDEFKKVVYRDGSTPNSMEADLDMDSHRVLNVADAVHDKDAVNKGQVEEIAYEAAEVLWQPRYDALVNHVEDELSRSLKLPSGFTNMSLPAPEPARILGWNSTGDALQNTDAGQWQQDMLNIQERELPLVSAGETDQLRVVRGGQSVRVPIMSLPVSTAVQEQIDALADGQAAGQIVVRTWSELSGITGDAGTGAQVIDDTGTHTDPVVGGTVANAGQYVWSESPAGWRWVREDALAGKVSRAELNSLIRSAPASEVVADIADAAGFVSHEFLAGGGMRGTIVEVGGETIRNLSFSIENEPDAAFAVRDANGYYSQYSPAILDASESGDAPEGGESPAIIEHTLELFAHRGTITGEIAPENSLDSYTYAALAGYDVMETDLQATSDGEIVLMHDTTLSRTCKNATDYSDISPDVAVSSLTLAQLRSMYVLAAPRKKHRRPVPTLREFADHCAKMAKVPCVEVKYTGNFSQENVDSVLEILTEKFGPAGYIVQSFDYSILQYIRTKNSHCRLVYLVYSTSTSGVDMAKAVAPAYYAPDLTTASASVISYARSEGVPVLFWNVGAGAYSRAALMGASALFVNAIAPHLKGQDLRKWHYAGGDSFSGYFTDGTIADGVLTLGNGNALNFANADGINIELGAIYVDLEFKGSATVSANNISSHEITNTSADFTSVRFQSLVVGGIPYFGITAGAAGCEVKDVRVTVAQFRS